MDYKILFIFVEGDDDEIFANNIIKPLFKDKYFNTKIIKYQELNKKEFSNILKGVCFNPKNDYIYLSDFDSHGDKKWCISNRKGKVINESGNILDIKKIAIVKEVIESWFLAVANETSLKEFKIPLSKNTEIIGKQEFNRFIRIKDSLYRRIFMIELLQNHSIKNGIRRNKSFAYFINKFTSYSSPSSPQSS